MGEFGLALNVAAKIMKCDEKKKGLFFFHPLHDDKSQLNSVCRYLTLSSGCQVLYCTWPRHSGVPSLQELQAQEGDMPGIPTISNAMDAGLEREQAGWVLKVGAIRGQFPGGYDLGRQKLTRGQRGSRELWETGPGPGQEARIALLSSEGLWREEDHALRASPTCELNRGLGCSGGFGRRGTWGWAGGGWRWINGGRQKIFSATTVWRLHLFPRFVTGAYWDPCNMRREPGPNLSQLVFLTSDWA